jgi:hypothetical protein
LGQLSVSANAHWETWVFDGETWEFHVCASMGDGNENKSKWSAVISTVAHPETAPGPKNIVGRSTGVSISAI